jgi:hypothetical protein
MQPKVQTFRPGGGSVLPSPTGRPTATSVGVGPIGCDVLGYVDQTRHDAMDAGSGLLQWSTSFLDWIVGEHQAASHAGALCDKVKAERGFVVTKKASVAHDTPEEIAANAAEFFTMPFSGALVEWNVYTDYVVETIPLVTYDPMAVLGYTEPGVATGFEEKSSSRSAEPLRLALWHALDPAAAVIQKVANQQCSRRFYLVTMVTVLLYSTDPSAWKVVADQTLDLRGPSLIDRFVEYLTPKPSGII